MTWSWNSPALQGLPQESCQVGIGAVNNSLAALKLQEWHWKSYTIKKQKNLKLVTYETCVHMHTCGWQHSLQSNYPLQQLISPQAMHWLSDLYMCLSPDQQQFPSVCSTPRSILSILNAAAERWALHKWHLFTVIHELSFKRFSSQLQKKADRPQQWTWFFLSTGG